MKVVKILILYLTQISVFFLAYFSYFGLFREANKRLGSNPGYRDIPIQEELGKLQVQTDNINRLSKIIFLNFRLCNLS